MTPARLVLPFIWIAPLPWNLIQPSLNPSSIWMRGIGFRMPWARKIAAQFSRGTASGRTGRRSAFVSSDAISF